MNAFQGPAADASAAVTLARLPTAERLAAAERLTTELERLGDEIAKLSAHIQAATYRLLTLIREFDQRDGWSSPHCRSCAHWLSWRTGLDIGAAREKVRVARALAYLPRISEAMSKGELSYSKVRAMTRVARPENEEELLLFARSGTAAHVERVVRAWRRVDRLEEARETERRHQQRYLSAYTDNDGMLVVRGRLEPEAGAALLRALEAATDVLYEQSRQDSPRESGPADQVTAEQMRADALGLVAESSLTNGLDNGTRGDRYQVVVHVDASVLEDPADADRDNPEAAGQSVLDDGVHVSAETSRRLACDCSRVVMKHAMNGSVLDVGRKTRTVSPALRRALLHRDRGCRFPGCGLRFCEAHHVEHWADGGHTKLENLVELCRRHHRAVHEGGYRVELLENGEARFFRRDGRLIPHAPAPPLLPADPVAELEQQHGAAGLSIDARTGLQSWNGERLDLAFAVDGLRAAGSTAARFRGKVPHAGEVGVG